MNRQFYGVVVLGLLAGVCVSMGLSNAKQAPAGTVKAKLPGARPTIDASDYPTLQAAFDAVGETGGMVQLPAGIFEIDEHCALNTTHAYGNPTPICREIELETTEIVNVITNVSKRALKLHMNVYTLVDNRVRRAVRQACPR